MVVTTHDIGRHLHCYGVGSVSSPNLDAFAAAGARFDNAFCTAPQCSPSRATLATGRYPHSNGVLGLAHHGFDWELDPNVPHAAALFASAGFESHLFGEQHVSLDWTGLGFDHHHGNGGGGAMAEAVEEVLAATARDQRLYLEINFEDTHRPYPPAAHRAERVDVPAFLPTGDAVVQELAELQEAIRSMDAAAGRVLAALDAAGRSDRALVVFTADHGLAMPRAKCTLYDPGIQVALLIRWPGGGIARGEVRPELVSNLDVLPTLLAAAGVQTPDRIQGRSLFADGYQPRDAIFAEKTFHSYYDPMRCVRTDRHKFIRNFETAFAVEVPGDVQAGAVFCSDPTPYSRDRPAIVELYDLQSDPLEDRNLAGTPEAEAIERELSDRLWQWMEETEDPLLRGPIPSPRYEQAMRDRRS